MARILVIDDDEVARLQIGAMLEADQHEVSYASNGAVAVRLFERESFHVCIVDLVMPVKNGLQTIREIMALDSNARIIAITGISPENLDMAKELGAVYALNKPVDGQKMQLAVRRALGRSRWWHAPDHGDTR